MKIKEKIRASFYVAPQTANVTAKAPCKYLMNLEKDLKFWVENMHTNRVRVDNNMLRQIALSLYEGFHKEDGTKEETSRFKAGRRWLHRFMDIFKLKNFKVIEQSTSADEEVAATFQTELTIVKEGKLLF
jgi:hypothetical protein